MALFYSVTHKIEVETVGRGHRSEMMKSGVSCSLQFNDITRTRATARCPPGVKTH